MGFGTRLFRHPLVYQESISMAPLPRCRRAAGALSSVYRPWTTLYRLLTLLSIHHSQRKTEREDSFIERRAPHYCASHHTQNMWLTRQPCACTMCTQAMSHVHARCTQLASHVHANPAFKPHTSNEQRSKSAQNAKQVELAGVSIARPVACSVSVGGHRHHLPRAQLSALISAAGRRIPRPNTHAFPSRRPHSTLRDAVVTQRRRPSAVNTDALRALVRSGT